MVKNTIYNILAIFFTMKQLNQTQVKFGIDFDFDNYLRIKLEIIENSLD